MSRLQALQIIQITDMGYGDWDWRIGAELRAQSSTKGRRTPKEKKMVAPTCLPFFEIF
jgi:hypothetical protein